MKKFTWLAAALFISLTVQLSADVWTDSSAKISADSNIVLSISFKDIKNSQLFKTTYSKLTQTNKDITKSTNAIKKACKVDILNEIDRVVVSVTPTEEALVFVKFATLNEKKLESCIQGINANEKNKLEMIKTGNIIEFKEAGKEGSQDSAFASWISTNTIVISGGKNAQANIDKAVNSKEEFLQQEVPAKAFKGMNLKSTLWGFSNKAMPVSQQVQVTYATAAIDLKGGKITAEIKLFTANNQAAKTLMGELKNLMAQSMQGQGMPKPVKNIVKNVKLSVNKEAVVIKLSESEKNFIPLINL